MKTNTINYTNTVRLQIIKENLDIDISFDNIKKQEILGKDIYTLEKEEETVAQYIVRGKNKKNALNLKNGNFSVTHQLEENTIDIENLENQIEKVKNQ